MNKKERESILNEAKRELKKEYKTGQLRVIKGLLKNIDEAKKVYDELQDKLKKFLLGKIKLKEIKDNDELWI